jgi:hypothetical protein
VIKQMAAVKQAGFGVMPRAGRDFDRKRELGFAEKSA